MNRRNAWKRSSTVAIVLLAASLYINRSALAAGWRSSSELPGSALDLESSIFRLKSARTGTAFVVMNQGPHLFLVTALHVLLADNGSVVPGSDVPCSLDHGSIDTSIPCKVFQKYPEMDLAVLTADSPNFQGHPLALGASDQIEPDRDLLTCGYPRGNSEVTWDTGRYRSRKPPYGFLVRIAAEEGQSGSPLIDATTHRVVGIVLNRPVAGVDQEAQMIEIVENALRREQLFRGVIELTSPPKLAPGALTKSDYGPSLLNAFENVASADRWYKRARLYQRTDTEGPWLGDENGWMGLQRVYVSSRREDTGIGHGWIYGLQYKLELTPSSNICTFQVINSEGVHEKFQTVTDCDSIKNAMAARVDNKSQLDAPLRDLLADGDVRKVLTEYGPSYVGADLDVARARFVTQGVEISTGNITYTFDANGLLRNVKKNKIDVDLNYDSQGRLATAVDSARQMLFEYAGPHLSAVRFSDGTSYQYGYNSEAELTTVTLNGEVVRRYEYDTNHHLVHFEKKGEPALERRIGYTDSGVLASVETNDKSYSWTFEEGEQDSIVHQLLKEKSGAVYSKRVFTFSSVDNSINVNEDGDETLYHLTVCLCLPLDFTNEGRKTSLTYDSFGRLIHKVTPLETTDLEYDPRVSKVSKVTRTIRSGTVLWSAFKYNAEENLAEASNNENQRVTLQYTPDGKISTLASSDELLTFDYNFKGKPVKISSKLGIVRFTYKPNGEVDKIDSDGKANVATETMRRLQRLIDITAPASVSIGGRNYVDVTKIPGDGNTLCGSCEQASITPDI